MKCDACRGVRHEAAFWIPLPSDHGYDIAVCRCCWFEIAFDARNPRGEQRRRLICGLDHGERFVKYVQSTEFSQAVVGERLHLLIGRLKGTPG